MAKGIPYTSIDISQDVAARQEMIRLSGKMATPVIVVGGEVVVGFDRGRLQRLLGI